MNRYINFINIFATVVIISSVLFVIAMFIVGVNIPSKPRKPSVANSTTTVISEVSVNDFGPSLTGQPFINEYAQGMWNAQ